MYWPSPPTLLKAPVKISGQPMANLIASTSGTDSDWVVKLIDVYPDEVAGQAAMGGYQLMVSADIFRGRYRESLETREADRRRQTAAVPLRAADGESRLPARTQDHGADPVELVPALRPQPADASCPTSSGPSQETIGRRRSVSITHQRRGQLHSITSGHDAITGLEHSARLDFRGSRAPSRACEWPARFPGCSATLPCRVF